MENNNLKSSSEDSNILNQIIFLDEYHPSLNSDLLYIIKEFYQNN
jgi:hypothetical protein